MANGEPRQLVDDKLYAGSFQVGITAYRMVPNLTDWNKRALANPFWRLYWNPVAGAAVELNGRRVALGPEVFVVIPPDTPFNAYLKNPVDHFYIHFNIIPLLARFTPGIFVVDAERSMTSLIRQLVKIHGEAVPSAPPVQLAFMPCAVVYWALSHLPQPAYPAFRLDARFRMVSDHIESHLSGDLRNITLAGVAGLGERSFTRFFTSISGMSPQRYVRRRRMERAATLLRAGDVSLERIAQECGLCDRHHLSRMFKHERGVSPATFRKAGGGMDG